jgi:hypothetical protein
MCEFSGDNRSAPLHQGATLVGPHRPIKDLGFNPCAFLCSELSLHKHFVQDALWQGAEQAAEKVAVG